MFDLKNAKIEDFEIVKANPKDPNKIVRCTYYRIKPGCYVPRKTEHRIVNLPKDFFDGNIQKGIHRIG